MAAATGGMEHYAGFEGTPEKLSLNEEDTELLSFRQNLKPRNVGYDWIKKNISYSVRCFKYTIKK